MSDGDDLLSWLESDLTSPGGSTSGATSPTVTAAATDASIDVDGTSIDFDDIFGIDAAAAESAETSPAEASLPGGSTLSHGHPSHDSIDRMFDLDASGDDGGGDRGGPLRVSSPLGGGGGSSVGSDGLGFGSAGGDAGDGGGGSFGELGSASGRAHSPSLNDAESGDDGDGDDFLSWLGADGGSGDSEDDESSSAAATAAGTRALGTVADAALAASNSPSEAAAAGSGSTLDSFIDNLPFLQGASATAGHAVAYRHAVRSYESSDANALRLKAALLSASTRGGGGGSSSSSSSSSSLLSSVGGDEAVQASREEIAEQRDGLLRQVLDLCVLSGSLPAGLRSAVYLHLLRITEDDWHTDIETVSHSAFCDGGRFSEAATGAQLRADCEHAVKWLFECGDGGGDGGRSSVETSDGSDGEGTQSGGEEGSGRRRVRRRGVRKGTRRRTSTMPVGLSGLGAAPPQIANVAAAIRNAELSRVQSSRSGDSFASLNVSADDDDDDDDEDVKITGGGGSLVIANDVNRAAEEAGPSDAEVIALELELVLTEYSRRNGVLALHGETGGSWTHAASILAGLLLLQPALPRSATYVCFDRVVAAIAPKHGMETDRAAAVVDASFRQWRLLLLYHDPELARHMDSLMPGSMNSNWATDSTVPQGWLCSAFAGALGPTLQLELWDRLLCHRIGEQQQRRQAQRTEQREQKLRRAGGSATNTNSASNGGLFGRLRGRSRGSAGAAGGSNVATSAGQRAARAAANPSTSSDEGSATSFNACVIFVSLVSKYD